MSTRFLFDDAARGRGRFAPALREWWATRRALRARHYDMAIDFRGDFRTIFWLACASGAPVRLSWSNVSAGRGLLTHAIPLPGPLHEVEANLRLVHAIGVKPLQRAPHLHVAGEAAMLAEERLSARGLPADRPRVGFHCFAISTLRTWPAERFAAAIDSLARDCGASCVLLGSAAESERARALTAQCASRPASLVGETTLPELAAVLSRLDLLVCLDSGLLHLAAAVGTPTVSLFGPGDPSRWRPLAGLHTMVWRGLPCSPCRDTTCAFPVNRCMDEIGVAEVVAAARRHLQPSTVFRGTRKPEVLSSEVGVKRSSEHLNT
jgi:ADP-heptose:LPS heptosyltransferase